MNVNLKQKLINGFKIGVLVFSVIVISLIFVEFGLRLLWDNPYKNTSPSKVLELRLPSPSMDTVLDRTWLDPKIPKVRFRTDSNRFLMPSQQFGDPDFTISFLGGSTTECSYVQESKRFPGLVSSMLFEENNLKINILNAGRSGNTLQDSINIFFNHIILFKPDYVVLMHATNDRGILKSDPTYKSRMGSIASFNRIAKWIFQSYSRGFYVVGFLRHRITMLINKRNENTLNEKNIDRFDKKGLNQLDPTPFYQRLKVFVHMARELGVEPILMTQPLASVRTKFSPEWTDVPDQEVLNRVIRDVAKEEKVILIDLSNYMVNNINDYEANMIKYLYDGVHVTDLGSFHYARHISDQLKLELMK